MLTLRKGGHRDLERYYGLMEVDFDSEELIGKLAIHRALSRGDQELLIAYDDETGLEGAYALVCCRGLYGYVLLKYLGVFPWYRGKGLGVELMRLIHKRYAEKQGVIAEITEFDDPEPDHIFSSSSSASATRRSRAITASPARRRTFSSSPSAARARTSRRCITACSRTSIPAASRPARWRR